MKQTENDIFNESPDVLSEQIPIEANFHGHAYTEICGYISVLSIIIIAVLFLIKFLRKTK